MTTLSLEASKKVFELVGEYETEWLHNEDENGWSLVEASKIDDLPSLGAYPSPNFSELIRITPILVAKIYSMAGEAAAIADGEAMLRAYMRAETEEEGMRKVDEYLMSKFRTYLRT